MKDIIALSLMLSCGCNLTCSYCMIHQSLNENSSELQKETVEALKNGEFLNNTVKSLERLKVSPLNIKHLEFWGQEPTLNLDLFTEKIDDWFNTFPNIQKVLFSTNGMAYPEKIIEFAKELDRVIKPSSVFNIQFSYDGDYYTNNERHGNGSQITNNIIHILEEFNKIQFKNLTVKIHFHYVLTREIINNCQNIEDIRKFYKQLMDWGTDLQNIGLNKKVHVIPMPGAGIEVPIEASSEDGINFTNFLKKLKLLSYKEKLYLDFYNNIVEVIFIGYHKSLNRVKAKTETNEDLFYYLNKRINNFEEYQKIISPSFSHPFYCGAYINELKIMYDGTLLNCQNQIFDTKKEFLKESDPYLTIKENLINHNRYINCLTSSDEEIKNVAYLYETARNSGFDTIFNNTLNLMYILAKAGQIDKDYLYNHKKLLAHGFIVANYVVCGYNKIIKTNSLLLSNNGPMRFFCNGVLDLIYDLEYLNPKLMPEMPKGELRC